MSYRLALLLTFPGMYVAGACLFLLSYVLMKIDLRNRRRVQKKFLLVNSVDEGEEGGEEEGEGEEGEEGEESKSKK